MDASQQSFARKVTLAIEQTDVGKFIGGKGSAIRNHVTKKARNTLARSEGLTDFDQLDLPRVTIKTEETEIVAHCTAQSEKLLDLVEENLTKHAQHFKDERPVREKICRLVFKTTLEGHLIGKYVGYGGQNCKSLAGVLEAAANAKSLDITSVRVNIDEPSPYRDEPKEFFFIKNDNGSSNTVFITVSAKFSGNKRDLFLAIKSDVIASVISVQNGGAKHQRDVDSNRAEDTNEETQ
jgi:predicted RNA-binding protein YlqC (UPF0109 family)